MENRNNIDNLPIDSQPTVNSQPTPSKEKLFSIILVAEVIIGVVLISLFIYLNFFQQSSKKQIGDNTTNLSSPTVTNSEQPTKATEPATSPYKVTWLDKPQKISSLDIFNTKTHSGEVKVDEGFKVIYFNKATFYLIGNLSDGSQLIEVFLPILEEGPGGEYNEIFQIIKSPNGALSILNKLSLMSINEYLSEKVSIISLSFKELEPPESISIKTDDNRLVYFDRGYLEQRTFDKFQNPKFVKSTEYGDLYVIYTPNKDNPSINRRSFYLKLKDWTVFSYSFQSNLLLNDSSVSFNWIDGDQTNFRFSEKNTSGCSAIYSGPDIIKDKSDIINSKEKTGNIDTNFFVYQIKDPNNSFLKNIYTEYKSTRDGINTPPVVSYEDFIKIKNHFLYQDFLGDWLIYINQDYGPMVECGKPVIYLYPQTNTQVKVQVGAQITKSEPTYPEGGWLVTAKPNGELTYQNQNYSYLFWEGLGNGLYPDYRNRGTVVNQKDLVSTLNKQLSQLGLNQKESADFMEFWQPKLPKTPYVRLTWLNTYDMDTLAPLVVTPRPDTSIRIFLEFQGLDKPVKLIPQTLSAPAREGFTLIEWGGLLLSARE